MWKRPASQQQRWQTSICSHQIISGSGATLIAAEALNLAHPCSRAVALLGSLAKSHQHVSADAHFHVFGPDHSSWQLHWTSSKPVLVGSGFRPDRWRLNVCVNKVHRLSLVSAVSSFHCQSFYFVHCNFRSYGINTMGLGQNLWLLNEARQTKCKYQQLKGIFIANGCYITVFKHLMFHSSWRTASFCYCIPWWKSPINTKWTQQYLTADLL